MNAYKLYGRIILVSRKISLISAVTVHLIIDCKYFRVSLLDTRETNISDVNMSVRARP